MDSIKAVLREAALAAPVDPDVLGKLRQLQAHSSNSLENIIDEEINVVKEREV